MALQLFLEPSMQNEALERELRNANRDPLLVEREKTHGDFAHTAHIAQVLKYQIRHLMRSKPNASQMEALDMVCSKIARVLSGNPNEKDHWADIAGYAKLGEEGCNG